MVSRKGRTNGGQKGMMLPKGITSSRPTTLWKMIKVLKDDGPADYRTMGDRMKAKWKNYPPPHSIYTLLAKRTDIFIVVEDRGNHANLYDLTEEIRNVMD
jgi:hypothetical protein